MRTATLLLFLFFILACTSNNSPEKKAVEASLQVYRSSPSDSTAQSVVQAMSKYIETNGLKDSTSARYLLQSARISGQHNLDNQALGFYKVYLINYPGRPDQANTLSEVITIIEKLDKPELSQVLYRSYAERFPKEEMASTYTAKIDRPAVSVDSLLK